MEELQELLNLKNKIGIGADQLDITANLFNYMLCIILSFIVRSFYIKFSYSLTGKTHIASVMPILSSVIFTVIVVVKSSLALSLGLVGALSIVRFRTPIKEPEELVYLFLIISVGLGFGAGYSLITTVFTILTLIIVYFFIYRNKIVGKSNEFNIVLDWSNQDIKFYEIIEELTNFCDSVKLLRIDSLKLDQTAVILVSPSEGISIDDLIESLKKKDRDINISFFEAKTNW